jgi:hypothetical protein
MKLSITCTNPPTCLAYIYDPLANYLRTAFAFHPSVSPAWAPTSPPQAHPCLLRCGLPRSFSSRVGNLGWGSARRGEQIPRQLSDNVTTAKDGREGNSEPLGRPPRSALCNHADFQKPHSRWMTSHPLHFCHSLRVQPDCKLLFCSGTYDTNKLDERNMK